MEWGQQKILQKHRVGDRQIDSHSGLLLVSNSLYSSTFLRALTLNRDMASLTIDLATRLSKREHNPGWSDSMFKQMRESEIVDLGRVFKKRVFAYLGNNVH
ncbi:hypothetical protein SLEP1_g9145 [Rubroshorea leprosula]|uniref:Uncharacterized protein n=1 Tax=Rubroshorea leprosula TaxID=152421 RepID=A0AAV5ICD5_9ROSI|nr:hypothetical protein SLEP1_g9145 [Rubroshorea leprosula]